MMKFAEYASPIGTVLIGKKENILAAENWLENEIEQLGYRCYGPGNEKWAYDDYIKGTYEYEKEAEKKFNIEIKDISELDLLNLKEEIYTVLP